MQDLDNVKLVEMNEVREANDLIFAETLQRVQDKMNVDEIPPLPLYDDDEKHPGPIPDFDDDDIKMEELVLDTATPSNR